MQVFFAGQEFHFFPGATVHDLIGRLPDADRQACREGKAYVADRDGHEIGAGGALTPDATYFLRYRD
ncbi:MAG: hypothetical protein HY692_02220 [Cyanobacteria bacterium NC_groundwater_1444_Ag_S-0.65um_54_12]|nr:hypothetical protein [Cyanobacteria bacterium NC_groundwater_1444_Ag_S-0.65um_54_12]